MAKSTATVSELAWLQLHPLLFDTLFFPGLTKALAFKLFFSFSQKSISALSLSHSSTFFLAWLMDLVLQPVETTAFPSPWNILLSLFYVSFSISLKPKILYQLSIACQTWHWHVTILIKLIFGFSFLRDGQTGKGLCAGPLPGSGFKDSPAMVRKRRRPGFWWMLPRLAIL